MGEIIRWNHNLQKKINNHNNINKSVQNSILSTKGDSPESNQKRFLKAAPTVASPKAERCLAPCWACGTWENKGLTSPSPKPVGKQGQGRTCRDLTGLWNRSADAPGQRDGTLGAPAPAARASRSSAGLRAALSLFSFWQPHLGLAWRCLSAPNHKTCSSGRGKTASTCGEGLGLPG